MKTISFLACVLVVVSAGLTLTARASVLDEIRALEANKEMDAQQQQEADVVPR